MKLVPEQVVTMARPLYHRMSFYWKRHLFERNSELQNLYAGQSCIAMGTGASLKNLDFKTLGQFPVLGCNLLLKHADFKRLNLCAYFEADSVRNILGTPDPYFQSGRYLDDLVHSFSGTGVPLIMNAESSGYLARDGRFSEHRIYLVKGKTAMQRSPDLSNDMAGNFTFLDGAVFAMVASAIYMGFKTIYLAGCDYTFAPRQIGHFYEDWTKTELLPIDDRHVRMHAFALARGVRILNLVPDGFESPLYPRVRIEDVPAALEFSTSTSGH